MRLFIAISLPDPVRRRLSDLKQSIEGVRWQRQKQLHITLKFLGDTPEERLNPLVNKLQGVDQQAFVISIKGLGYFPKGRRDPRILWAGVSNHTKLVRLHSRIEEKCVAMGYKAEGHPFKPHITLGRIKNTAKRDILSFINQHKRFVIPEIAVTKFVLYESKLRSEGAVHKKIEHFPLTSSRGS